jgi:DNA-binding NtrC family response regulator
MKKIKVLWVEDSARLDLPHLAAPIYMDGNYDLVVAETVSDGIAHIQNENFDAIIVDIRIPPGDDPRWIKQYHKSPELDNC